MDTNEIIKKLKSMESPKDREGMARFGINPNKTLGISVYKLRDMAKCIGKNHNLAQQLWASCIHEARLLAAFIDEPNKVTERQMDSWAKDFDSWDVCDEVSTDLFDQTPFTYKKAIEWSSREEEFVKRAAFALMAGLSVHDKKAADKEFERFLLVIRRESTDERNFVKKAVNWALRNIGKRNLALNKKAIEMAREIQKIDSKSARWIASDALRELQSAKVQERLRKKTG